MDSLKELQHHGAILRKIAKGKASNIREAAEKLGISHSTIYDYFKKEELEPAFIEKVAETFNVSTDEFPSSTRNSRMIADIQLLLTATEWKGEAKARVDVIKRLFEEFAQTNSTETYHRILNEFEWFEKNAE